MEKPKVSCRSKARPIAAAANSRRFGGHVGGPGSYRTNIRCISGSGEHAGGGNGGYKPELGTERTRTVTQPRHTGAARPQRLDTSDGICRTVAKALEHARWQAAAWALVREATSRWRVRRPIGYRCGSAAAARRISLEQMEETGRDRRRAPRGCEPGGPLWSSSICCRCGDARVGFPRVPRPQFASARVHPVRIRLSAGRS